MPHDAPEPTDDDLLTRDELLERLRDHGETISADDLQNWQLAGVIPYGVRRRYRGATRLLYPLWMIGVLRMLRHMQREASEKRTPLSNIAHPLRTHAHELARAPRDRQHAITHSLRGTSTGAGSLTADLTVAPGTPPELEPILRGWAREHERVFGSVITHVDVSLVDDRGHPLTYRFPVGK